MGVPNTFSLISRPRFEYTAMTSHVKWKSQSDVTSPVDIMNKYTRMQELNEDGENLAELLKRGFEMCQDQDSSSRKQSKSIWTRVNSTLYKPTFSTMAREYCFEETEQLHLIYLRGGWLSCG